MNDLPPTDGPTWPPVDPAEEPHAGDMLPGQASFPETANPDTQPAAEVEQAVDISQPDDVYLQPADAYDQPADAYGQPADAYGQSADPYAYSDIASSEAPPEATAEAYQASDTAADASGAAASSAYAESRTPTLSTTPSYLGNRQDMTAFLAMLAGVASVAMTCIPCGGCIPPVFALVAGSIALKDAGLAVNPARARQHAIIGVASGLLLTLGLLVGVSLYAMFIGAMIAMSGGAR